MWVTRHADDPRGLLAVAAAAALALGAALSTRGGRRFVALSAAALLLAPFLIAGALYAYTRGPAAGQFLVDHLGTVLVWVTPAVLFAATVSWLSARDQLQRVREGGEPVRSRRARGLPSGPWSGIPHVNAAVTMYGQAIVVTDGDTLRVALTTGRRVAVRLYGIDAPEAGQPGDVAARRALYELTRGRTLMVHPEGVDVYGRIVGRVSTGEVDVSAALVYMGLAWALRGGEREKDFRRLERMARRDRRGIWCRRDAVPPLDWRRGSGAVA